MSLRRIQIRVKFEGHVSLTFFVSSSSQALDFPLGIIASNFFRTCPLNAAHDVSDSQSCIDKVEAVFCAWYAMQLCLNFVHGSKLLFEHDKTQLLANRMDMQYIISDSVLESKQDHFLCMHLNSNFSGRVKLYCVSNKIRGKISVQSSVAVTMPSNKTIKTACMWWFFMGAKGGMSMYLPLLILSAHLSVSLPLQCTCLVKWLI